MFDQLEKFWGKTAIYTFPKVNPKDEDRLNYLENSFFSYVHFFKYIDESEMVMPNWEKGTFKFKFMLDEMYACNDHMEDIEYAKNKILDDLNYYKKIIIDRTDDSKCLKGCGFRIKSMDEGNDIRDIDNPETLFCRVHLDSDKNFYTLEKHLRKISLDAQLKHDAIINFLKHPLPKILEVHDDNDNDDDLIFKFKGFEK